MCTAVHATAFSPSTCVQAVCLCHSRVSSTLSSPLAWPSLCAWNVLKTSALPASFLSIPRALPKYHCSETAQPSYSIKSAVLHRPCGPGLALGLFSFLGTPHLLKDCIVDFLAFVGLCMSHLCPSGRSDTEGLLLSLALGGVHSRMAV